ncbi:hypothetical protein GE21DRAFT_1271266 [Neurospora crassa]|nr:hypothetical protein GE21DRAFT_1271266 [Neurospora crassa]
MHVSYRGVSRFGIVGWIVRCLSTKRYHAPFMETEVSFLPLQATPEIKKSIPPVPAVGISVTSASPRLIQTWMMKTIPHISTGSDKSEPDTTNETQMSTYLSIVSLGNIVDEFDDNNSEEILEGMFHDIPTDDALVVPSQIAQWAVRHSTSFEAASLDNEPDGPDNERRLYKRACAAWRFCAALSALASDPWYNEAENGIIEISGWEDACGGYDGLRDDLHGQQVAQSLVLPLLSLHRAACRHCRYSFQVPFPSTRRPASPLAILKPHNNKVKGNQACE